MANRRQMDTHNTEQAPKDVDERQSKDDPQVKERGDLSTGDSKRGPKKGATAKKAQPNNVRKLRTERMMSKAELARRAGLSTLTIDRVERGMPCRMDTKRKILEALGLTPSDRVAVFGDEE